MKMIINNSHRASSLTPLGTNAVSQNLLLTPQGSGSGFSRPSIIGQQSPYNVARSYHRTSTTALQMSSSIEGVVNDVLAAPVTVGAPILGLMAFIAYFKYRASIRKRLKKVQEESWLFGAGVTMERVADKDSKMTAGIFQNLRLLELNPEFKEKYDCEWSLLSLGDYLSSLRPKQLPQGYKMENIPKVVQLELESGLALALLKALGPNMGAALMPVVGIGPVQSKA
jgi:hypothetical protein